MCTNLQIAWPRLTEAQLYLCTDARRERGDLAEFADAALAGGVDIIQLRDKGSPGEQQFGPLEAREELEALAILADAARRHDALLAVNDRADIAVAAGADVLHLGQDDLPLSDRAQHHRCRPADRPIHPRRRPGGRGDVRRCRLLLRRTVLADADKTGPRRHRALTWCARRRSRELGKPWFAIGGIDSARLPEVIAAGARRIVVVRAITAADDPRAAARLLKDELRAAC